MAPLALPQDVVKTLLLNMEKCLVDGYPAINGQPQVQKAQQAFNKVVTCPHWHWRHGVMATCLLTQCRVLIGLSDRSSSSPSSSMSLTSNRGECSGISQISTVDTTQWFKQNQHGPVAVLPARPSSRLATTRASARAIATSSSWSTPVGDSGGSGEVLPSLPELKLRDGDIVPPGSSRLLP